MPAPTGSIPLFDDLQRLFRLVRKEDYKLEQYVEQFTTHIPENLAKIERIEKIYLSDVSDTPPIVLEVLRAQRHRLLELQKAKGDYVSPLEL